MWHRGDMAGFQRSVLGLYLFWRKLQVATLRQGSRLCESARARAETRRLRQCPKIARGDSPCGEDFRTAAKRAKQSAPGPDGIGYRFSAMEGSMAPDALLGSAR